MGKKGKIHIMKHFVVISLLLLAASPALAQDRAPEKLVLLKTTSDQRALTEALSARIKSALLGEKYIVVQDCKARDCGIPSR